MPQPGHGPFWRYLGCVGHRSSSLFPAFDLWPVPAGIIHAGFLHLLQSSVLQRRLFTVVAIVSGAENVEALSPSHAEIESKGRSPDEPRRSSESLRGSKLFSSLPRLIDDKLSPSVTGSACLKAAIYPSGSLVGRSSGDIISTVSVFSLSQAHTFQIQL